MATITQKFMRQARAYDVRVLGRGRRGWGSAHPWSYGKRRFTHRHFLLPKRPAGTLWFHITVTHDDGPKRLDFIEDMRETERIGDARFNSGFSYNLGWDLKTGMVGVGQALDAKGTHTVMNKTVKGYSYDQNGVALAIAGIGYPGDLPTDEAITELVKVIGSLILVRALTADFDFNPHRMAAYKDCPTQALVDIMHKVEVRAKRMATIEAKRRGIKLAYQYQSNR